MKKLLLTGLLFASPSIPALSQMVVDPSPNNDLLKLAEQDDPQAQAQLCQAYFVGDKVEKNLEKAYFWCNRAVYRTTMLEQDLHSPVMQPVLEVIVQLEQTLTVQQKHHVAKQLLDWQPRTPAPR